jgi:hypothetical protein
MPKTSPQFEVTDRLMTRRAFARTQQTISPTSGNVQRAARQGQ